MAILALPPISLYNNNQSNLYSRCPSVAKSLKHYYFFNNNKKEPLSAAEYSNMKYEYERPAVAPVKKCADDFKRF